MESVAFGTRLIIETMQCVNSPPVPPLKPLPSEPRPAPAPASPRRRASLAAARGERRERGFHPTDITVAGGAVNSPLWCAKNRAPAKAPCWRCPSPAPHTRTHLLPFAPPSAAQAADPRRRHWAPPGPHQVPGRASPRCAALPPAAARNSTPPRARLAGLPAVPAGFDPLPPPPPGCAVLAAVAVGAHPDVAAGAASMVQARPPPSHLACLAHSLPHPPPPPPRIPLLGPPSTEHRRRPPPQVERVVRPDMAAHAAYGPFFEAYKALYGAVRPVSGRAAEGAAVLAEEAK